MSFVVSTLSFNALGQQKNGPSLQKQLVGQWSLASAELIDSKGNKGQIVEGADPQGFLVFLDNGRFTFQVISAIPKLARAIWDSGTPEESKAVARDLSVLLWNVFGQQGGTRYSPSRSSAVRTRTRTARKRSGSFSRWARRS